MLAVALCVEILLRWVYMWVCVCIYVCVCVCGGGGWGKGVWMKWLLLFCCPLFLFFHTKLPRFTGGNVESWWTERVFSEITPPDRLNYKCWLILPGSLPFSDNGSCYTMSFEANFKASHVPLPLLWPKYEAGILSCTQRKLQSVWRPHRSSLVDYRNVSLVSQPLQGSIPWDSRGVQLGPCLGDSAEGTPVQCQAPGLTLGHYLCQIPRAIKRCSSNLSFAFQQQLIEVWNQYQNVLLTPLGVW